MTTIDRDSCARLGILAPDPVPATPDVRPAADELAPISEGRPAFETTVGTVAAVAVLVLAFIP